MNAELINKQLNQLKSREANHHKSVSNGGNNENLQLTSLHQGLDTMQELNMQSPMNNPGINSYLQANKTNEAVMATELNEMTQLDLKRKTVASHNNE
jgi:hypothetical protein